MSMCHDMQSTGFDGLCLRRRRSNLFTLKTRIPISPSTQTDCISCAADGELADKQYFEMPKVIVCADLLLIR